MTAPFRSLLRNFWWIPTFGAFLSIFLWGMNANVPLIGHDFFYAFPHMIAGTWHLVHAGITPFRFSPFFCGGLPQYGNPQDFFYSLPQFLAFFLDLWNAVEITLIVSLILGYTGWYRFGRDVTRLESHWAHVLALVIIANGYYFMHMVVGHLTYHALTLVGFWLWLLLDHRENEGTLTPIRRVVLLGILTAYMLYSGGYFAIIVSGMCFALIVIGEFLLEGLSRERLQKIIVRTFMGGIASILLCLSKLVAVWSVMRILPRTTAFDVLPQESSSLLLMLKAFWGIPQGNSLLEPGENLWGIHEYSMFLSPVVALGLIIGTIASLRSASHRSRKIFFVLAVILILGFATLIHGDSWLAIIMSGLPVFSSMRVVVRFLYIPVLLLSIIGIASLRQAFDQTKLKQWSFGVAVAAAIMTVLLFLVAYIPLLSSGELELTFPLDQFRSALTTTPNLYSQSVTKVEALSPDRSSDLQYVLHGSTGRTCYEPLLLGVGFSDRVEEGPVTKVGSGTYNMRNPACLQYPKENSCAAGERISVQDTENLQRFQSGQSTTWHLSILQHIADWTTVLTLIISMLILAFSGRLWHSPLLTRWRTKMGWQQAPAQDRFRFFRQILTSSVHFMQRWLNIIPLKPILSIFHRKNMEKPIPDYPLFRRLLQWSMVFLFIVFVVWISSYKLFDRDFWWHIKAGEIMWKTKALIAIDPFAFARVGQAYISTHEWLAQILMYWMYSAGGATGIIIWRTVTMAVCFGLLLSLDRPRFWINAILAVFAANIAQLGFVERPQLFTYVLFCFFLIVFIRALRSKLTWQTIVLLTALQILWVNFHGAACFLGILLAGTFFLQNAWDWYSSPSEAGDAHIAVLKRTGWLLGFLTLGVLVSPNITHTLTFITSLLADQTVAFIQEWQPRAWAIYLSQTGLLWIPAVVAISYSRKHLVFSIATIAIFGIMSRIAFRHEMLFVFAAVAITYDQLSENDAWKNFLRRLLARPFLATVLIILSLIGLVLFTMHHYRSFAQRDGLFGYGVFDLARGAEDYVEREHLQGNAFNTYGIGGYLIYRRYPTGKVYIDGRNVDYGLPYMMQTYEAGFMPERWKEIEQRYGFHFALVDYDTINEKNKFPYSSILDKDPSWALVYMDDWVAVYLKNLAENKALIKRDRFAVLTPAILGSETLWNDVPKEKWPSLERDLRRVVEANAQGAKGHVALAQALLNQGKLDEAKALLDIAKTRQPYRAKIYELLAAIALKKQDWQAAADAYDQMLANAGDNYPELNYSFVSDVYTLAGHPLKAWYYRLVSGKPASTSALPASPSPSALPGNPKIIPTDKAPTTNAVTMPSEQTPAEKEKAKDLLSDLMTGTAQDIQNNNDRGIDLASSGNLSGARDAFMKALMLDPGYPVTLNNLCALDIQERNFTEAKEYCERALERGKDFADAHFNLAIIYLQARDATNALIHIKAAEKNGRDVTSLRSALAAMKKGS